MKKISIGKILILLITIAFLSGCIGSRTTMVEGAKVEEVWSIGLFTPTVQMVRMSKCVVEEVKHDGGPHGTPWTEKVTREPCQTIGTPKDGFIQNSAGPVGPPLLGAAATVGGAIIINDGLRNQNVSPGDNITNNNNNRNSNRNRNSNYNSNRNSNRNYNYNRNQNYNRPGRGWGGGPN